MLHRIQKRMNVNPLPVLEPLEQVNPVCYSELTKSYFAHYGLDSGPKSSISSVPLHPVPISWPPTSIGPHIMKPL